MQAPPSADNVVVKKYDPKAAAAIRKKNEDEQYLISPLTNEKIPASKAAEHMKVNVEKHLGTTYSIYSHLVSS